MKKYIKDFLKKETVFFIATFFMIITCFFVRPKFSDINFHVLFILFNLMVVVEVFRDEKFLDAISISLLTKFSEKRLIIILLNISVFFMSMLLTNDVALITFIPLTIIVATKANFSPLMAIVLETLSANIGGSFTPMGNPQNLFIFSKYNLTSREFFSVTTPLAVSGFILIIILCYIFIKKDNLNFNLEKPHFKKNLNLFFGWLIFFMTIASIFFNFNPIIPAIISVIFLLRHERKLLKNIDYMLLLTFVSFFIFSGNFSNIGYIKEKMSFILKSPLSVYLSSIFMSQFISNVPAAIVASEFTNNWKSLLLGVNIGGQGTLVASLASLISYKFFINSYPKEKNQYLKIFTLLNFLALILLGALFIFG